MIQDTINEIKAKEGQYDYYHDTSGADIQELKDKMEYIVLKSNSNFDSASRAINNTRMEIVECKKHIRILYISLISFAFITTLFAVAMVLYLVS